MRLINADTLMITIMDKDIDHTQGNDGAELCQIIDHQPTVKAVPIEEIQELADNLQAEKDRMKLVSIHNTGTIAGLNIAMNRINTIIREWGK